MPLDVLEVTNRFMPDPVRILVKKDELTLEGMLLNRFELTSSQHFRPSPSLLCRQIAEQVGASKLQVCTPC